MIEPTPTLAIRPIVGWDEAFRAALATVGIDSKGKEPTFLWKVRSLMAEHSQVKLVQFCLSFKNLRQWVGVHLIRHPYLLPFIHSQRVDRRNLDEYVDKVMSILSDDIKNAPDFNKRDYLFQGEANDQDFYVNAQTLVNISRKRLCTCASNETREAWQMVKELMQVVDPAVAHCMVRNCVYRGFCPEMHPACDYTMTKRFGMEIYEYRRICASICDMAAFSAKIKSKAVVPLYDAKSDDKCCGACAYMDYELIDGDGFCSKHNTKCNCSLCCDNFAEEI